MTAPADMTDAEMDAAVAERVMDAEIEDGGWYWRSRDGQWSAPAKPSAWSKAWSPTTDPRDWMMVVERMRELGGDTFMGFWNALRLAALAHVTHDSPIRNHCGDAFVLYYLDGRAICIAALEAVGE